MGDAIAEGATAEVFIVNNVATKAIFAKKKVRYED